jgi:predicted transposase/invertase (TIGR01784 family)
MRERIIFYLSKLITEHIDKGAGYKNIKRAISIVITDYVLVPETNECHDQFFLYSELTKTRFSDIVEIDTLELPKIPADRHNEKLWQWTKFLAGKDREEFMELAQTSPMMKKAVGVLMELNTSQRRRMLADARQKARWDEQARIEGAEEKGIKIGMQEGEKKGIQIGMYEGKKIGEAHGAARAYKELGIPIADIVAKTGLSVEEIERL